MPEIELLPDPDALARRAAVLFAEAADAAVSARGRFSVALSGGSTPEKMHRILAEPAHRDSVDWASVRIFLGDERMVPADDPRSNFGMARRTLLDHVPIPSENVYAPETGTDADASARAYEGVLRTAFPAETPPAFDLIFLGLGDDGHTASLFPGKPALHVIDRWVVGTPPGVLPPPVDRITLTYPVINAARLVVFLVAGANKAATVRDVLEGGFPVDERPATGVKPTNGRLVWLLDEAAAAQLAKQ